MSPRNVLGLVLGLLVAAVALHVANGDEQSLRFGDPASRAALAALPPDERLNRAVLDLDRRLEGGGISVAELSAPARHLHAVHHHDGAIGLHGIPTDAALIVLLSEAYAAIGRPELAAVLRDAVTAGPDSGEALRQRWIQVWRRGQASQASQVAYLDNHLDDIVPTP